jgi:hypothetical protein
MSPTAPPPAALSKNPRLVERSIRGRGARLEQPRIPFANLKSRMIDDGMSLGQAIHSLRPGVDADQAAANAMSQANAALAPTQTSKAKAPR